MPAFAGSTAGESSVEVFHGGPVPYKRIPAEFFQVIDGPLNLFLVFLFHEELKQGEQEKVLLHEHIDGKQAFFTADGFDPVTATPDSRFVHFYQFRTVGKNTRGFGN